MRNDTQNKQQKNQRQEQQNAEEQLPREARYKIDYKKFSFLIGSAVLIIALVAGITWFFKASRKDDSVKVYDVAIQLKDQKNSDPEEDLKTSLKAGDVILVRETGKAWSRTEEVSCLIIKMKIKESQAGMLTEPEKRKLSRKEAKEKGIIDDERIKKIERKELKKILIEDVRMRKYRVKIEDMDFDMAKVREKQPFPDKEFGWEIVEKKKKLKK